MTPAAELDELETWATAMPPPAARKPGRCSR